MDVSPNFKTNQGPCEGRCDTCTIEACRQGVPLYGTLGKPARDGKRRVRGCKDIVARNKRNRRKGDDKARKMRKALGLAGANTRHEELWGGAVLTEMKAGASGGANKVWTAYRNTRAQADFAKAFGDPRPFIAGFSPDGTSHCLYVIRDDDLEQAVLALAGMWGFLGEGEAG